MKAVTVLAILGTVLSAMLWNSTHGIPKCLKEGYNPNEPCAPYGAEEGWYSHCSRVNDRWVAYPYRCGRSEPANETSPYKVFETDKCGIPETPVPCPAEGGEGGGKGVLTSGENVSSDESIVYYA